MSSDFCKAKDSIIKSSIVKVFIVKDKTGKLEWKSQFKRKSQRKSRFQRKSQVFSLDMIFGLVIFIVIFIGAFWAWHLTENRIIYTRNVRDMSISAQNAAHLLVTTTGIPTDWNLLNASAINDIDSLGLLSNRRASLQKIERVIQWGMINQSYNETKKLLGIIGPGYEFNLTIGENSTGMPYLNSSEVVGVDRALLLEDGSIIKLELRVWR